MNKNRKPWLNESGFLKNNFEIQLISEEWNRDTWNQYLSELECPKREILLKGGTDIENIAFVSLGEIFSDFDSDTLPSSMFEVLDGAIEILSQREKEIVELLFWKNKNPIEASEILGTSGFSIRETLARIFKKLKEFIRDRSVSSDTSPLSMNLIAMGQ